MSLLNRSQLWIPALLVLATGLTPSCSTAHQALRDDSSNNWLEASPNLQRRIEDEGKRLPWSHGVERVDLIHWFASVGEPAYPTLLAMAGDERKDVAIAALAALGATRDSRLVHPLRDVAMPDGPEYKDLQLERARTLLRLGDWDTAPRLIAGLRDERLFTRALCSQALTEATHESLGYDPKGEESGREEAVKRWEQWWEARSHDHLLPKPASRPNSNRDD